MEQHQGEILVITTGIIVFAVTALVVLFTIFQRRKNWLLVEQEEARKRYEREITETQIEIREETLKNISWELHDNIGQLLTLAKIQLSSANQENISEVSETIGKSLSELRLLSKLINPDAIKQIKLKEAIQLEIDRFNRLNFLETSFNIQGKERNIDEKAGIIMFRIIQEFFSNTVKHSRATHLNVTMDYLEDVLEITAQDNGVGFHEEDIAGKGIGLLNMKNRATLIGAVATLKSVPNQGTSLKIRYNYKTKHHEA